MVKHIIFDLDGTLIDSKEEILKTYQIVFNEIKPQVVNLAIINYGATLQDVLSNVYGEDFNKIEKAKILFSTIYDRSDYHQTNPYPNVLRVLTYLKTEKYNMYIATNKRLVPTLKILNHKNLNIFFSDVITSDIRNERVLSKAEMISELKRKYAFSEGFMVGDTSSDIKAGNIESLKTIAVTYGYENRDIFAPCNPSYTIDSFDEIIKIVET